MAGPDALDVLAKAGRGWRLNHAAMLLAEGGVPVFPCAPGGKTPITRHGHLDATTDRRQVRAWWRLHPWANIGIPTGAASGLVVVDVDVHGPVNGMRSFIRAGDAGLLKGWGLLVSTPTGGQHAYFPAVPGVEQRSWQAGNAGIDFRGDGGYIIAPPSIRIIDGIASRYKVARGEYLGQPLPVDSDRLRDFLDPRPAPTVHPAPARNRDVCGYGQVGGVAGQAGHRPEPETVLGLVPSRRRRRPRRRCRGCDGDRRAVGLRRAGNHAHRPQRLPKRRRGSPPARARRRAWIACRWVCSL